MLKNIWDNESFLLASSNLKFHIWMMLKKFSNSSHDALILHSNCHNIFTFGRLWPVLSWCFLYCLLPAPFLFFFPFHIPRPLYAYLHSCIKVLLNNPFKAWITVFSQPVHFYCFCFTLCLEKGKYARWMQLVNGCLWEVAFIIWGGM